jgi:uncharacterized metal-binding protein
MASETSLECARCRVPVLERSCLSDEGIGPGGCPTLTAESTLAAAGEVYLEPGTAYFAHQASIQEAAGYSNREQDPRPYLTRIEEVCAFAHRMGFKKLGLAFCAGLIEEAGLLDQVLVAQGFEVASAICKVGCVAKENLGIDDRDKIRPGTPEPMCNPVAQAELLNRAGTEFNLMLGLCVGHDALFLRHATAYNTVVAVKDRVLCHNPIASLYTSRSYYSSLTRPGSPAAGPDNME